MIVFSLFGLESKKNIVARLLHVVREYLCVLLFSLTVVFSCSALTLRCDVVLCVNTARKGGIYVCV